MRDNYPNLVVKVELGWRNWDKPWLQWNELISWFSDYGRNRKFKRTVKVLLWCELEKTMGSVGACQVCVNIPSKVMIKFFFIIDYKVESSIQICL